MDTPASVSFVGQLTRAGTLMLLGGCRRYESRCYESPDDAERWVAQAVKSNVEAGRPCTGRVLTSHRKPEIPSTRGE